MMQEERSAAVRAEADRYKRELFEAAKLREVTSLSSRSGDDRSTCGEQNRIGSDHDNVRCES